MDQSGTSFSLNDPDLRLSASLCQWAGFELDGEVKETILPEDHSAVLNANENVDYEANSGSTFSPGNDGERTEEMLAVVREFLLEKTSQFYNDIVDAQGEKWEKAVGSLEKLRKRYAALRSQTASILGRFRTTGIEDELNSRLKSIDAALRQLSIVKSPAWTTLSLSSSDSGRSSTDELRLTNADPLHHWRQWIEAVEAQMYSTGQRIDWNDREQLEQRLKAQQALQSQIEHEGGYWVTLVQKYIDSWPSSHRRQIVSSSIERRWHTLWIKSLEWQCRLERQIRALLLGIVDLDGDDADLGEPVVKRRRLSYESINEPATDRQPSNHSGATVVTNFEDVCSDDVCSAVSDTIPFSENEYEPLTPRSPPSSHRGEEEPISARDGGYSSGSSAIMPRIDVDQESSTNKHDTNRWSGDFLSSASSSPHLERRARTQTSPATLICNKAPTTPDDPLVPPSCKFPVKRENKSTNRIRSEGGSFSYNLVVPSAEMTDSLLVNVGDTTSETMEASNQENTIDYGDESFCRPYGDERCAFTAELEEILRRRGTPCTPLIPDTNEERACREPTPTAPVVETPPNTPCFSPQIKGDELARSSSSVSLKRRYPTVEKSVKNQDPRARIEKLVQFYQTSPTTPEDPAATGENECQNERSCNFLAPPNLCMDETTSEPWENENECDDDDNVDCLEEILKLLYQGQDRDKLEIELEELLLRGGGGSNTDAEHMEREENQTGLPRVSSTGCLKRRRLQANRKSAPNSKIQVQTNIKFRHLAEDSKRENSTGENGEDEPFAVARSGEIDQNSLLNDSRSGKRFTRTSFRRLLYRSWPIQVCLCIVVCLNLFYFYPSCCEHMNRYWWSFGPKTYYSQGPPPT